ncbi:MAG: hypothetical protein K8R68_11975, partial [Bacteroidales bacterium]|nr:hypothetical protein [Bacteroidales bacterium]
MKNTINFSRQIITILLLLITVVSYAQTRSERIEITKDYDLQKLEDLSTRFHKEQKADKEEAIRLAEINNWEIMYEKNGVYYGLQRVNKEGRPVYYKTCNVDAAVSTRTNHLHNTGSLGLDLEGQSMTAYIWDFASALQTHQEFDDSFGNDRVTVIDTQMPPFFHSTHVVGTILALGVEPQAKGMAPQANAFVYDWDYDLAEAANAALDGMLISNHSYHEDAELVEDWEFGAYT